MLSQKINKIVEYGSYMVLEINFITYDMNS